MAYTPYKMTGHELPGPNQQLQTSEEELLTQNTQQNAQVDQPNNQLNANTTDLATNEPMSNNTSKKKVDVEVTVNGQPV